MNLRALACLTVRWFAGARFHEEREFLSAEMTSRHPRDLQREPGSASVARLRKLFQRFGTRLCPTAIAQKAPVPAFHSRTSP